MTLKLSYFRMEGFSTYGILFFGLFLASEGIVSNYVHTKVLFLFL